METQLPGARNPHSLDEPLFHVLADDDTRYPEPDGAPVELVGADKKSAKAAKQTTEGKCTSDGMPMDADSFAHR